MKLPEIKKLVERYDTEELTAAQDTILNGGALMIEVGGEDEGEQLTHVMAAIWIQGYMEGYTVDFRTAQREYVNNVRKSIN
jgi:hypothetical protein